LQEIVESFQCAIGEHQSALLVVFPTTIWRAVVGLKHFVSFSETSCFSDTAKGVDSTDALLVVVAGELCWHPLF
jgi:hypothetical protein